MKAIVYFAICSCWSFFVQAASAQSIPKAQIVLFTPSDVEPPAEDVYLPRLHQFGEYAEKFFHDELKAWGYDPKRKKIFERGANDQISVIHVKGDLKAAGDEYRKEWISRQVLGKLRNEHQTPTAGQLFWIFVYIGDPPKRHDNYRGTGNAKDGGWAVLNYTNIKGDIDPDGELVSDFHHELFLKGAIHEFGHGLGLPHIGPKVELKRGNSLMGPVTRIYRARNLPKPDEGYLTEASAAILSTHPVFTGDATARGKTPATSFENLDLQYNAAAGAVVLKGKLTGKHPIHRIIVIDDRDDKPGAYWVKGYVAKPNDEGQFSVSIERPKTCSGNLQLLAVYTNGAVTGDGIRRGIGSACAVPYQFSE